MEDHKNNANVYRLVVSQYPCQRCWDTVRVHPLSELLLELFSELSHCQLWSEFSHCQNSRRKLIPTLRFAELMDKKEFQRENLEESMAGLVSTMETRSSKLFYKPNQLQTHQIIAVNWMAEKKKSLAKGSLLADNCGTRKVRSCWALDTLYVILTIIRLWHHWL